MADTSRITDLMEQGAALHASGHVEQALVAFEKALALAPDNTNAASACATLLMGMGQPQAALQVLSTVREQLLADSDGATNLAIAAEACGQPEEARTAYARALDLDPDNLRALNNSALMSARDGDWDTAVHRLERCQQLQPDDPGTWRNLADTLMAARRFGQAGEVLAQASRRFPHDGSLHVRGAVALAFDGQIEPAQHLIDGLDTQGRAQLAELMARANAASNRPVKKAAQSLPDAYEMFNQQAFEAMLVCDWRDHDRLTAVIRELLARATRTGQGRDWRDAQFYGLMLPLHEDEMAQLRVLSIKTIGQQLKTPMAPFVASRASQRDGRIHVGLAIQSLRDPRIGNALQQQLRLHDQSRFAIHVYSPTPKPDFAVTEKLARECASAIEIAHMTNDEAVARMRLDGLDIFVDMAFDTPWCRPEIPERRVAPIQIRQTTWHRHHPPRPCEYNMSDVFVHPADLDMEPYGAVVRLPHTCWLATNNDLPEEPGKSRADLGLPGGGVVLCALLPALMVDPQTFASWMKMLKALPDAVFWLPAYNKLAQHNLAQAARSAGIDPVRIVFQQPSTRPAMLANIRHADLFVDALRFNANHGLVDALRMGVPAISCAGQNMASRLGGSILHAAGMGECVVATPSALLALATELGRNAGERQRLRQQLARQHAVAPLFDPAARVHEWEAAWAQMVERHRAGLPAAAFDVAAQPATKTAAAAVVSPGPAT